MVREREKGKDEIREQSNVTRSLTRCNTYMKTEKISFLFPKGIPNEGRRVTWLSAFELINTNDNAASLDARSSTSTSMLIKQWWRKDTKWHEYVTGCLLSRSFSSFVFPSNIWRRSFSLSLSFSCLSRDNRFLQWCMYRYYIYSNRSLEHEMRKKCARINKKKAARYKKKKTFEQGKILARRMTCSTWSPTVKGKRSLTSAEKAFSWSIDRLLVCRVGGENRAPSITLVLEESQVAKHLVSSKKRLKRWRYVHNRLDRRSTDTDKKRESSMSADRRKRSFLNLLWQILLDPSSPRKPIWQRTRDYRHRRVLSSVLQSFIKLTFRSTRYCISSFVVYRLRSFSRQWWRIWIVTNTKIYSLPTRNFSQILNNDDPHSVILHWKSPFYFDREISSLINWNPSLSQLSGIQKAMLCVLKWCRSFGSWRNSFWAILLTWCR